MKIKQVEELVGISVKNIRFYEDQGLLTPKRAENGYREYSLSDVKVLKEIKLFRKLGVSVETIKSIISGNITVSDCLEEHLVSISNEQNNLNIKKALTERILETRQDINSIDCDTYLEEVGKMEKEGIYFVNLNKEDIHSKKKRGAYGGAIAAVIVILIAPILLICGKAADPDLPIAFIVVNWILAILAICGIIYVTVRRINEIEGGEEDEASKY